jgi:DNA-binding MarR family transcriptional regulator
LTATTLPPPSSIVDRIMGELEPLIARQRRAVARQGCLRAISSTQLHVLFLLESGGTLPMGQLADLLDVSLPNVTGIVDRMVEHGLVERIRDADDRRLVLVRTTDAGRRTVEEIDMVRRQQLARVLEVLDPVQQRQALRTFQTLRAAADRLDAGQPDA